MLFRNCYDHFHNLEIILLMLNNFKDKIVNFMKKLYRITKTKKKNLSLSLLGKKSKFYFNYSRQKCLL